MKYEKIFEPNLIVKLMKESIEFLAKKELLIDMALTRGTDRKYLEEANFEFKNNKIYINGLPFSMQNTPWRAIKINRNNYHFIDGNLERFNFDDQKVEIKEEIQRVFNILSKNKKNELERLLYKLCDKLTVRRISDFISFLDKHLEIRYSTVYGFDGGSIEFVKIYPYNMEGRKKSAYKTYIRNNLKEIKYMKEKIECLVEDNKRYKEKIKSNNGLVL